MAGRTVHDPTRIEHLRRVLERAVRASGGAPLLVLTHQSPDPDALGALVGVCALVRRGLGLQARAATGGRIHRAENLAMVRELELSFESCDALAPGPYAGALLVDSQPGFGNTVLPEGVPVLAVFDHHEPRDKQGLARLVPHVDLRPEVGATSSLVYSYLRDTRTELDGHTATALFCGVRFDTGDLSYAVSPLDEEAYIETFRRADRAVLARIQRPELPREYYRELHRSLQLTRAYGPLVLGLLGDVRNPESVAEMADFFLRMRGCSLSVVGGAFEGTYSLSVRTDADFGPAFPAIERMLDGEGSFGGHGRVAGARIPLESADEAAVRRLERRIKRRALELVDPGGRHDSSLRRGRAIT